MIYGKFTIAAVAALALNAGLSAGEFPPPATEAKSAQNPEKYSNEFGFKDFDAIRTESEPCSGKCISGYFHIKVVQDSRYKVTIETDGAESDLYSVKQSGKVLILTSKHRKGGKGSDLSGADVTVHLPVLSSVHISGFNTLDAEGSFRGENLDLSVSGAGVVSGLSGTWDEVDAGITGAGSVSGLSIYSGDMDIDVSGAASVAVSSLKAKEMDMDLSGGANIRLQSIDSDKFDLCCSGAASLLSDKVRAEEFGINMSGGSRFEMDGSLGSVHAELSGAANLVMKGSCETMTYSGSGGSSLGARQMTFRDASVSVSGAAAASLTVTGTLTTSTSFASRIDYYGSPKEVRSSDRNVHAH